MSISVLVALAGFLSCALAAPVGIDTNTYGMTPCLMLSPQLVCNEQAAIVGECWKGVSDTACTCPSIPYLDHLKVCIKASCPYSDWELAVKLHVEVCKTPFLEGTAL
ncbi:hypothetical protein N7513_007339 [Penicillium frequentans]|nr:hypothetical protein N7513_007339 [Penicillium glabrum]